MTGPGATVPKNSNRPSRWRIAALGLVLSGHLVILAYEACEDGPTLDEPAHLAAGIYHWQFHRFDLYAVNPPLVRMIAAAPVLLAEYETDWRALKGATLPRPEFAVGDDFVRANGAIFFSLLRRARLACLGFSLIGAWACFRWADRLYGPSAAVLALVLWCASPLVAGHGHLITADVPGAALGVLSGYLFWSWLVQPTYRRALITGVALGLALLAKSTLVIFGLAFPVLWLVRVSSRGRSACGFPLRASLFQLVVIGATALYSVNAFYGFDGTFHSLRQDLARPPNEDAQLAAIETIREPLSTRLERSVFGTIPLPLPRDFVRGIHLQLIDLVSASNWSYLHGAVQRTGWWYFYLVALLIKEPCGYWLLGIVAILSTAIRPRAVDGGAYSFCLPVFAVCILGTVSHFDAYTEHTRYAIGAIPFLTIWFSRVARIFQARARRWQSVVMICIVWAVASPLWSFPHSLCYFNELVGGPLAGPRYLWGSNVDWGQDLFRLQDWMKAHAEIDQMGVAYYGRLNPKVAGIQFTVPPRQSAEHPRFPPSKLKPGRYAVSANFVYGMGGGTIAEDGSFVQIGVGDLRYFREMDVRGRIGYTMLLYRVDGD
jgi:hypothetical protein